VRRASPAVVAPSEALPNSCRVTWWSSPNADSVAAWLRAIIDRSSVDALGCSR
jgi:hypothetical protein